MNQQLVTIFDSGYADAFTPFAGVDHHPDLESKTQVQPLNRNQRLEDRLVELRNFSNSFGMNDLIGHGSIVAGIIAGEGQPDFFYPLAPNQLVRGGGKDAQGFFYGSGIAPRSSMLVARFADPSSLQDTAPGGKHDQALQWARSTAAGADRSLLVNESWNQTRNASPNDVVAVNQYDQKAQFYDGRVRDANTVLAGTQPMTVIFSAGNQAFDRAANQGAGAVRFDSVGSPATAKNVVTVGASASYRPAPEPPLDCRDNAARFVSDNATNISQIGLFSGRGRFFSAGGAVKLHQVRVKPDLVAPAIRVFSTVPFNSVFYGTGPGCAQYYPPTSTGYYYTYGTGTSFASPVVTGVAAYARKWFLDQTPRVDPSPSMLKAALIATADNLGGQAGNDHRPSPNYGWGRVNLGKLVDGRIARFFVESPRSLMMAGQTIAYERRIDDPTKETVVVLTWLDPPSDLVGDSQAPLKNVLQLRVDEIGSNPSRFYVGNNFNENKSGVDNGTSFRFQGSGTIFEDRMNNVEVIVIPAGLLPAGSRLRMTVTGKSLVPESRQFFSLYATNVRFAT
ncbi:MAG TPA: S8 family serine peptidase [Thermoanaerobaculia bacterium]|nr:S8 family serine peptidase [Thermoanaerobaculia bacterium]